MQQIYINSQDVTNNMNKSISTPFSESPNLLSKPIQDKLSRIMDFQLNNCQINKPQSSFHKSVLTLVAVVNIGFIGIYFNRLEGWIFRRQKSPTLAKVYYFQMISVLHCTLFLAFKYLRQGIDINQNQISQYIKTSLFFSLYLLGFIQTADLLPLDQLYIFINYDISLKILFKMIAKLKDKEKAVRSNKHEKISTSILVVYYLLNVPSHWLGSVSALATAFSYYKYD